MESLFKNGNVTIMVEFMDASINFYTEKLGFIVTKKHSDNLTELYIPGLTINLHSRLQNISTGDNLSIGLRAVDFESTVEKLREKGIELEVMPDGWTRIAYFADPDNNLLYVYEDLSDV